MSSGGVRIGAGRPKGTKTLSNLNAEQAKQALIKAYIEHANPINEALITKAKTGDIQAIKELHDRVYGKAPQDMNLNGSVNVKHIISIDE